MNHFLQIAQTEAASAAGALSVPAQPERILIVKLGGLGDVIHALPAAQAIRAAAPKAHLAWAVESSASAIVRCQPWIDEVVELNRRRRWRGYREFLQNLRRTRWDATIDFQGSFRSGVATYLSRARRRIGYLPSLELAHLFYNECLPLADLNCHAVERDLGLAAKLGGRLDSVPVDRPYLRDEPPAARSRDLRLFPLQPTEGERAAVEAWRVSRQFVPGRDQLVVLNPFASRPAHRWPAMHYIKLAQRLLKLPRVRVALSGGIRSRSVCDQIAEPFGDALWRADGRFSPLGMAELFSLASAVVTGDCGVMHLAIAAGAPVVALFGASNALRSGPYAANAVVLDRGLACSPCLGKRCPLGYDPPACLEQIGVDRVLAAVVSRLAQSQTATPIRKSA